MRTRTEEQLAWLAANSLVSLYGFGAADIAKEQFKKRDRDTSLLDTLKLYWTAILAAEILRERRNPDEHLN